MLEGQGVTVKPEPIHVRLHEHQHGLRIEVIGRSRWWLILLAAFHIFWSVVGLVILVVAAVVFAVLLVNLDEAQLSSAVVGFGAIAFLSLWTLLFLRFGWWGLEGELLRSEVILIDRSQWHITRDFGLWIWTEQHKAARIREVRLATGYDAAKAKAVSASLWRRPGKISFRTGRFSSSAMASAATTAEAQHILAALYRVFPQFRPDPESAAPVASAAAPARRWTIAREYGALRLMLPVRRRWAHVATMVYNLLFSVALTALFWFLVPAINEPNIQSQLLSLVIGSGGAWLSLWSLRELIWHLRGVEVVEVQASGLTLQNAHLLFSRPRAYQAEYITGLRSVYQSGSEAVVSGHWRRPGMVGALAFNYGAATYRFGEALTPAEADEIVQLILEDFPHYGRDGLIGPHAE